ncbi:hypothetical protein QQF64_023410 [Cirrhinus molitorella]|uniref:Murine leukemia virus integrase C-terminal domain-containing protein n=1 Tax=Cirrhinus molitorella TaxID=172907 RepID=A0ABR3L8K1_9TELE
MLKKFVASNQKDWDVKLPLVLMAIRATPSQSTGMPPFELMTGRQMTLPLHLLYQPGDSNLVTAYTTHQYLEELQKHLRTAFAFAQQQLQKSAEGRKAYYDQKASREELEVGDKVWYYHFSPPQQTAPHRLSKELLPHWTGPYEIVDKLSPVAYRIRISRGQTEPTLKWVHCNQIKRHWASGRERTIRLHSSFPKSTTIELTDAAAAHRPEPLSDKRTVTARNHVAWKVYVRLDPRVVYRAHYPRPVPQVSWAGGRWTQTALDHAEVDITHMLTQLQKVTVTQADLSGQNRRTKRFLGELLGAATAVGTLFNLGITSVNAVSLATVRRHVNEIQTEMPQLQAQLTTQSKAPQTIGKSLKGTVVVLNTHSVLLNQTVNCMKQLFYVVQSDYAHSQLVTALMADMLREVSSSVDSLAIGRIPPYLVPLSLVQTVLASATSGPTNPVQAHLAYSLGSAIPLHIAPEQGEMAFLLNLPIIEANNIYRLKDMVNVGFWQDSTHLRIQTPDIVAYHDSNDQLYLAPNLRMCTLTKDIHYLCPNKPFLRDNTEGICRMHPMRTDTRCPAEAKPRAQVTYTQGEIVGDRWLVNTPARVVTLTYDQHDTATRINLLNQTMWIQVPKDAILHIDDLALYHLPSEEYHAELEISNFFRDYNFTLSPELEMRIAEDGPKLIDITPIDQALQALDQMPALANLSIYLTLSSVTKKDFEIKMGIH